MDLKKELAKRVAGFNMLLAADIGDDVLKGADLDLLAARLAEAKKESGAIRIVSRGDVAAILTKVGEENLEKTPAPIEVSRKADFKPAAAEIHGDYKIINRKIDLAESNVNNFVQYFRDRLAKIKEIMGSRSFTIVPSIETLGGYADGREVVVAGMVESRITTKNKNLMVLLEDETGEAKVIFMKPQGQDRNSPFDSASRLVDDEIVAVKGKISGPFVIAKEIMWPDTPIMERKTANEDFAIAFMSDLHIGSKAFMERNFSKMLEWLNGNVESRSRALAGKIKYVIVNGDIVDGIGIYPNQEKDLAIFDIYQQYRVFRGFLEAIPDYMQVFVLPGNHDAVQRAEPQPEIPGELLDVKMDNVHLVTNPADLILHGMDVLAYHGTSINSIMNTIPGMNYADPEDAMIELLKRRHLSPIYGGNVIVPTKNDGMVIGNVPDILHMGHIHKNGLAEYHGVQLVNSGTWQSRTDYQIKNGLVPTPCELPVFEAKRYAFTTIDFKEAL